MTGRIALPIPVVIAVLAFLFAVLGAMPQAAAQALGPDEAHGLAARVTPKTALSAAQKRAIYNTVARQRLRNQAADIPLIVGAPVPHSAALLALPDQVNSDDSPLKYAIVDDNVVLVDSITMRVIDIIRGGAGPLTRP
jgi:hypothetical protein